MNTTTNILAIPHLTIPGDKAVPGILSGLFAQAAAHSLNYEPWPANRTRPQVTFSMFYNDEAIFIKFKVKEKYYRAHHQQINDAVYEDSCVEFFIGFGENEPYYNFEFNAAGIALVGYGEGRNRQLLAVSVIKGIKTWASKKETDTGPFPFNWELTAVIPFTVFNRHHITSLKGLNCRANFYKCGDKLPEPHFICWNNIIANEPNFHLPQYFGKIVFE